MSNPNLRGQYAGFVSRFVAFIIDLVVVSILSVGTVWLFTRPLMLIGVDVSQPCGSFGFTTLIDDLQLLWCWVAKLSIPVITFLIFFGYPIVLWTLTGQTVGKYALGLRIVRKDGQPIKLMNSVRRLIGYYISLLFVGIGFLWILVSNQRQGWHDKFASTYVIYVWDARQSEQLSGRIARFVERLSRRRTSNEQPPALPEG